MFMLHSLSTYLEKILSKTKQIVTAVFILSLYNLNILSFLLIASILFNCNSTEGTRPTVSFPMMVRRKLSSRSTGVDHKRPKKKD